MSTQTITEFLEARIAEDEAAARAVFATAAPDAWENPTRWGNFFPEDIAFYDTQTPARVLAECAAKRKIIGLHDGYSHSTEDGAVDAWCALNAVLKDLAAVYADHADYQQEWAL